MSGKYGMGINGFGRIGRLAARVMLDHPNCNLKAINSGSDVKYMAYQFKYDSVHGRYKGEVDVDGNDLIINGHRIRTTQTRVPSEIPWGEMGVDYLCESTGQFLSAATCQPHIDSGVKKVVFSAPAKDNSPTIVLGVNQEEYTSDMTFVSCASCTTNGLAPMVKVCNHKHAFCLTPSLLHFLNTISPPTHFHHENRPSTTSSVLRRPS